MIRQAMKKNRVRTLFISDVHLGCRYARVEPLLDLLNRHDPEYVYIVGDFIDGWRLRKRWHWEPIYNAILSRLFEMSEAGSKIRYAPGNHDDFLRDIRFNFGFIEIADEFIHNCPDGRRFLVTHGDKFDQVETKAKWLSVLGSFAYDSLCWFNQLVNTWRRHFKMRGLPLAAMVKKRVKAAVTFVSDFETNLVNHARDLNCQGVVCGHIHTPAMDQRGDVIYCNTGDWIENATALLEYEDGRLEIVDMQHEETAVSIEDSSEFVLKQGEILRNMLIGSSGPATASI
ncbi:UDP-2,3-diacylglucosamine diphosphatase [Blastopirellula sp. JC732]|uniref:UDP-2,3-diacylglucosamine diphosphatase n=1 Tax=Blastopirellula sediminis TaxID=2894196 RepID=A0A9X1SH26_9BACT|nr:UDP-2,3-diacylglucosamine diphosphatase [Blastopirellula sediminis]MCC9605941.1 UDP-2,3-diacylglucosamine diphosphatase [Blastopirellula sediminis]MCC9630760.1 UDP-2,3-diacylglucosamine diphosphatase [Blastopirellula sediminis]